MCLLSRNPKAEKQQPGCYLEEELLQQKVEVLGGRSRIKGSEIGQENLKQHRWRVRGIEDRLRSQKAT